ncbi:endonuclease III [Guggenheimella bovis]
MTQKVTKIVSALEGMFPDAKAELDFTNPFELLVATILSAQTTDVRVNQVTKVLFKEAPGPSELLAMEPAHLEEIIQSIGMYRTKAKNLQGMAKMLIEEFHSSVPSTREELVRLPGVGNKTASVVLSNGFDVPAIAVDTHVKRVSFRLGLTKETDPDKVQKDLERILDKSLWSIMHHRLIFLGRRVCSARSPKCNACDLEKFCPKRGIHDTKK